MKTGSLNKMIKRSAFLLVCLAFLFLPGSICSEENKEPIRIESGAEQFVSLSDATRSEQESVKTLTEQLRMEKRTRAMFRNEVNIHKLNLSSYDHLLMSPNTTVKELEKIAAKITITLEKVTEQLNNIRNKLEIVTRSRQQTNEQLEVNRKHVDEIKTGKIKSPDAIALVKNLNALLGLQSVKKGLLEKLYDIYNIEEQQLAKIESAFAVMAQKSATNVKERKRQALFVRKGNALIYLSGEQIEDEINRLYAKLSALFSVNAWHTRLRLLWDSGRVAMLTNLFLFFLLLAVLLRLQRMFKIYQQLPFFDRYPALRFAFFIFQKSFFLAALTVVLYLYSRSQFLFASLPLIQPSIQVLWLLLVTQWALDLAAQFSRAEQNPLMAESAARVRIPVLWVRAFGIFHIVVSSFVGDGSVILFVGRFALEVVLCFWFLSFVKFWNQKSNRLNLVLSHRKTVLKKLLVNIVYIILIGALLLEITGYSGFALYWLISWGQTSAALLWAMLIFFVLKEWFVKAQKISEVEEETEKVAGNPFRWVLIWLCWLSWLGVFLIAVIAAWGGRQTVIVSFLKALNYPLTMGNMRLSLLGFIYAFLILLFTHGAVRVWRYVFQDKVLARSDIEIGLQESIATIAVYVFWTLGIIMALYAVGLNATSLTVGLGALGIGLGFGLQNIFNNFISGIILLFERPIQVGDAVEINGIWAWVRKINVRSTVVQTWDNASLIIPNSEFISSQVTNWSFRDMSLRRHIVVGVAYGSDIERVKEILLEIAAATPRVLKNPKPDVLFSDFGDSALIFKLRVWTRVDHMLAVESDVRFKIDQRFRECGITIAFPQRDIHIRSHVESKNPVEKNDINS